MKMMIRELALCSTAATTGVTTPMVEKYSPSRINPSPMARFWFMNKRALRARAKKKGIRRRSLFISATEAL